MRQLADLAFVMQDYETAQSTLKLLAGDYKTDKAYKHLAGVQVNSLNLVFFVLQALTQSQNVCAAQFCNACLIHGSRSSKKE